MVWLTCFLQLQSRKELILYPEERSRIFLRNVPTYLPVYAVTTKGTAILIFTVVIT
jgi:hypothetical protein